jgi:hypothetical protein
MVDKVYTVSLTLSVQIESDGILDSDREKAWEGFKERFNNGWYDADSIDIELEEEG